MIFDYFKNYIPHNADNEKAFSLKTKPLGFTFSNLCIID